MENSANELAGAASEKAERTARDYSARAREYANSGIDIAANVSNNLSDFVRREPWIAMAAAFAVGYVLARAIKRVSP